MRQQLEAEFNEVKEAMTAQSSQFESLRFALETAQQLNTEAEEKIALLRAEVSSLQAALDGSSSGAANERERSAREELTQAWEKLYENEATIRTLNERLQNSRACVPSPLLHRVSPANSAP